MGSAVFLIGGSQTDFSRNWGREDLEIYDMFAEVLREAIADADVEPAQIDVGHVGNFVADLFAGQGLMGGFFGQVYPELAMLPTSRHVIQSLKLFTSEVLTNDTVQYVFNK